MAKRRNLSSETTSSGESKSNATGNRLERFVQNVLNDKGYAEFWNHKNTAFESRAAIGGKQYMRWLPVGETIYHTTRIADFLIVNAPLFPSNLIIECKWQQVGGSVDEKYPFLLFNIIKTGIPTVVLLDGGGYKPAALAWLKDQADPHAALIAVWTMAEFQTHVNNGFLG